jgi:hypothetical protein
MAHVCRLLVLAGAALAGAAGCGSPKGGPTDAPTATLYGAGACAFNDAATAPGPQLRP